MIKIACSFVRSFSRKESTWRLRRLKVLESLPSTKLTRIVDSPSSMDWVNNLHARRIVKELLEAKLSVSKILWFHKGNLSMAATLVTWKKRKLRLILWKIKKDKISRRGHSHPMTNLFRLFSTKLKNLKSLNLDEKQANYSTGINTIHSLEPFNRRIM